MGGRGALWERKGGREVKGQPDPGVRGQKSKKDVLWGSLVLGGERWGEAAWFESWRV